MRKVFTYRLLAFVIMCLLILPSQLVKAQWTLDVMGTVKKEETKKRLEGATITIKRNGSVWKTFTSPDNGKFNASLLPDAVYVIEFSKPGHVTKRIELSTKHVPPEDAKYGFDFPMEMNLFEEMEGLDVSVLNQPIAKVAFNPATGYMDYDPAYTKSIKNELDRLKKELAERLKAQEAERKEKQKSYDAAIAAGDKAFNAEKWADAKPHYEKAASIFPKEAYPPVQLAEIKAQLEKNAAEEKAYKDAIAEADAAFKEKEWEKATAAYEKASDLKIKEQYPKDKIKEIATIVANEDKINADYNEAISSADQALGEKEYDRAKEYYNKALSLKSFEQYPKDKLKEIGELLAELAKKDKGYNDAIAEGDTQLKAKAYQKAIDSYNTALTFKPEEVYPKDKIAEAETLLEGLKQLQENYDQFIADADAAFSSKEYATAKSNYEEALNLKENEQYPKDKIAEIAEILGAAAKLEEDYNEAIAQGDKAFGDEDYEAAQTAFEKALSLKSEEEYPQEKIDEIKTLLEELAAKRAEEEAAALAQKKIDDKYNALIASADNAFGNKDYDNAVKDYEAALDVKSEEKYPKEKLEEIEMLLAEIERKKEEEAAATAEQKEINERYNGFIADADAAFKNKEYDLATENYREASDVKPEEQYPKDRIKAIEDLLAELERKKKEEALAAESERKKREYFDALIAEADGELLGENYEEAEKKYNQALGVIPDEQYPKDKIQEIKDILAKIEAEKANANLAQKQLDEKYKKLIAEADNAFGSEDYTTAKSKYKAALNVKEEEVYPQDQLSKIEEILAEIARKEEEIKLTNNAMKQKLERYNSYVKIADADFDGARYDKAISNYELALGIMPDKTHPKNRIEEIKGILADLAEKAKQEKDAELAEKEKRANYEKLIYEGDRAIRLKEYKKAQGKFNAALNLYPDEQYPSDKLAELLELMKTKQEEEVVAVTNTTSGSRAKIDDSKEKEIEAKMAALLKKKNAEKAKALQKDQEWYKHQEEIRISGGITRTKEAEDQLDRYADDILAQKERGNKYHLENNEKLLATTELLKKAEEERIKDADNRREEADRDLEVYEKEHQAFVKEQEELSKDKTAAHNDFVDDVNETELIMIERGEKMRAENRKDLEKLAADTEKNRIKSKKRSEALQIDVNKYKEEIAKEEEIRITAAVNRTEKNDKEIQKLEEEMVKQKEKKSKYYKLNVDELMKFKERIDKLEKERIKRADKARAANQKLKEKMEAENVKNRKRQNKRYYKDIKYVDKFKKEVTKQELANVKRADKRRVKANREIVKSKEQLNVPPKSQERRYRAFKEKLDEEKKQNADFNSDLRAMEQEKILLANAELDDFYMGEKQLSQDDELSKKYAQGITEETLESGNSITIKRIKVTGNHVDVYERVFYTWGGTFFYKNGVNITQALWDKESIE